MTPDWTEEEAYELNRDRLQDDIRDEIDSKPRRCFCREDYQCRSCGEALFPNEDV